MSMNINKLSVFLQRPTQEKPGNT